MDGRIQDSVTAFLRDRFQTQWVDVVSEAGPVSSIAQGDSVISKAVYKRVQLSIDAHQSCGIALVAHEDCAAVPGDLAHKTPIALRAAERLRAMFPEMEVIALWAALDGEITLLS
jgi:hypothetical protein